MHKWVILTNLVIFRLPYALNKKRHKWHCCKCIHVPIYNQGFFKTVIVSFQRLISILRDAWEPGSPFLYHFIINLSPSSVNEILVKMNLIFLCPSCGRHPVAQLLQPSGPISTSSVSILKGNGLYTYHDICMFSLCAVLTVIVWWSDITVEPQKLFPF